MKIITLENDSCLPVRMTKHLPNLVERWLKAGEITESEKEMFLDFGEVVYNFYYASFAAYYLIETIKEYDVFKTCSTYATPESVELLTRALKCLKHFSISGKKHYEHYEYLATVLWNLRLRSKELRKIVDWGLTNNEFYQMHNFKFVRITPENIFELKI